MHIFLMILLFQTPSESQIALKQFPTALTCQTELDTIFKEFNKSKPNFNVTGSCVDFYIEVPRGA